MLRFRKALSVATAGFLLLTLLSPVFGSTLKTDLAVYLEKLHAMYPEAEVTGRFYDWRSLSMYRSHAGMHLGYDIALNAGRGVPAGWAGRVTGIIPWTATEFGVQVQVSNGFYVTYGHVTPCVREGQYVTPGLVVGFVARDHVDIKVRNGSGGYFDWGQSYGALEGGPWSTGLGLLPTPPYEGGGTRNTGGGIESLLSHYSQARLQYEIARVERDRMRNVVSMLSEYVDKESAGLPEAEQQLLSWYRAADSNKISEAQVEAQSLLLQSRRAKVNRLIYVLEERQRVLRERESALQVATARSESIRRDLDAAKAEAARVKAIEATALAAGEKAVTGSTNPDINRRTEEARTRMQALLDRYRSGATAKTTVDDAVRTFQRLHLVQVLWEHGDKDVARGLNW